MTLLIGRACGVAMLVALLIAAPLQASWDPDNGDWSKTEETDLRVMTWNVYDTICTTADKTDGWNSWCAAATIVAAMQPDVLILQETGDNGSGVDSVADLTTVMDLFLHGGNDPFNGGTPVTAYVQAYAPAYDLPYIFVSTRTDAYNRNTILSRYPFADLNGDNISEYGDMPFLSPDAYQNGGTGGIRGFQIAEIDLPAPYCGDVVVGNSHLKAGSDTQDKADRLKAAQNIAYLIDYWYNGAGTGTPDPNNKVLDSPAATMILDDDTPVIWGGDWNEDELYNGRKGPAEWMTMAEYTGGSDGTDRDRTDSTYDTAVHYFTGSRNTKSSSKLDYLARQDSIATLRLQFVFNTSGTPTGSLPPEVLYFAFPSGASGTASDHLPVIIDVILCTLTYEPGDCNCDGAINGFDIDPFLLVLGGTPPYTDYYALYPDCDHMQADVNDDGAINGFDIDAFVALLGG